MLEKLKWQLQQFREAFPAPESWAFKLAARWFDAQVAVDRLLGNKPEVEVVIETGEALLPCPFCGERLRYYTFQHGPEGDIEFLYKHPEGDCALGGLIFRAGPWNRRSW